MNQFVRWRASLLLAVGLTCGLAGCQRAEPIVEAGTGEETPPCCCDVVSRSQMLGAAKADGTKGEPAEEGATAPAPGGDAQGEPGPDTQAPSGDGTTPPLGQK